MIQDLKLNALCSLILDKTINDSDKYQNGRTKIFFRAGMLAALETLRADRLNAMVTVVQKNMRRHMAMKRYREMRVAAIRIQTWWRGILAKRFVAQLRRETAAVRLQRAVRRYVQRKRFTGIRKAVVRFQSRT
jgi:myosin V